MIYFLSDAHIGSRAIENGTEHQQRVVNLLRQMSEDATAIYLLGDIFDFWYEYLWRDQSKQQFAPLLNTLRELSDKGIEVHYFIGNHDIWTFGALEQQTHVIVHRTPYSTVLQGKRIFMAHGDGLVPSDYMNSLPPAMQKRIRSFMRLRAFFHHPMPQFLFRLLPPALGNYIGYEWARRSRQKELAHPCGYKGEDKEELVLYAKEQEQQGTHYDYYLFGHRHIELDLMINANSRVLILGDMFRQWTFAQMDGAGNITLESIE